MSKRCCSNEGSLYPMRQSAGGAENMAPTMPGAFAERPLPERMSGTSVAVRINGKKCWLWRAVDQDGYVLDEIVQVRRNTKAARRLLIRLLKKQGLLPKRMVTDKLSSYGAAKRQVIPDVEHRSHKGLNNRAENSHPHFENGSKCGKAFDRSEACSISFRSSLSFAISSFHPV
jgi:putative transposase